MWYKVSAENSMFSKVSAQGRQRLYYHDLMSLMAFHKATGADPVKCYWSLFNQIKELAAPWIASLESVFIWKFYGPWNFWDSSTENVHSLEAGFRGQLDAAHVLNILLVWYARDQEHFERGPFVCDWIDHFPLADTRLDVIVPEPILCLGQSRWRKTTLAVTIIHRLCPMNDF